MADFGLVQEQFNNLTGDIELNPSSFGLFMRDIEEASLNLKTAIYSGNVNLTADFYKQMEALSEKKYNAIDPDGSINTTRLGDTSMIDKSPGLYMNHQRLGYWDGDDWKAFIGNTGEMWLGSITETNYLHWDGTQLDIRGNLLLSSGETVEDAIAAIPDPTWDNLQNKPDVISSVASFTPPPTGSGFKLSNTHLGYYNNGVWKTYMQSNGNFGLSGTGSNGLTWNGSTLSINGNVTITGGSGYNNLTDKPDLSIYAQSSSLGTLATLDQISYVSGYIVDLPTLGALSSLDQIDYLNDIINKPILGNMSSKDSIDYVNDIINKPNFGSLAFDSIVEIAKLGTTVIEGGYIKTTLINAGAILIGSLSGAGSLAGKNSVDYTTEVTNTPFLGTLAGLNQIDYLSGLLTNKPTLGTLAALNSVSATYIEDGSITITKMGTGEQSKLNNGDSAYSSTSLWLYPSSTLIDGGKIFTGSITANQIQTNTLFVSDLGDGTSTLNSISTANSNASSALSTANSALSAANSKNKTFYQSTTPIGANAGDLWYDTSNNNRLRRYDGSSWVTTYTEINGGYITTGSINADLITSGTITGRTIQTASSGQRIVIDSTNKINFHKETGGLVGYLQGTTFTNSQGTYDVIKAISANIAAEFAIMAGTGFISGTSTSYMAGIRPHSNNSYDLGTSSYRWSTIYANDVNTSNFNAPNTTVNIYGFKINRTNVFPGAPGGSPVGRMQFMTTDANGNNIIYVIPIYNP